jgi:hypothetical protein
MIARVWRGWIDPANEAEYVAYVEQTGIDAYRRACSRRSRLADDSAAHGAVDSMRLAPS